MYYNSSDGSRVKIMVARKWQPIGFGGMKYPQAK